LNVISFYAPRPEHPFFQDYRPYLSLLRASCERFGHRHIVLTDDPMEVGADDAYVVDLPRSLMKAVLAAQYAYLSDPEFANTPTVLVGADCVLANDPEPVFDGLFDIGITVGDFADCRMNTGAIFIPRPCQVAEIWADALAHVGDDWGDDQTSLYRAILERPTHGLWWATLKELPVDPYNLAPEWPGDDCTRGVVLHFRGPRKRWMVDYCHNWLGLGEGVTVKTCPNTSDEDMLANVRANVVRKMSLAPITLKPAHGERAHAVLVGGGPSLESTLWEIERRAKDGQTIFALNGAAKWLNDRGVRPHYTVILDPRPSNADFIGHSDAYLLASQCAPETFERAEGLPAQQWHFAMEGVAELIGDGTMIGGSVTVGLTAMSLVHTMGYRKIHLYGYDSSDADGQGHAYEQEQTRAEGLRLEAWCAGRRFECGPAMYAQATQFEGFAMMLADAGAVITVHGDGLLPTIARQMSAAIPIEKELAV
jgi:hypothetical protein